MHFIPLFTKFEEIADKEMAIIKVEKGAPVPAGMYAFIENYCDDASCDCRKAMVNVIDLKNPSVFLATIGFGWESLAYYTEWMYGDKKMAKMMVGSYLEMAGQQSKYAQSFLELWKLMTGENKEYVARLKKHYVMFKKITNFEITNTTAI